VAERTREGFFINIEDHNSRSEFMERMDAVLRQTKVYPKVQLPLITELFDLS